MPANKIIKLFFNILSSLALIIGAVSANASPKNGDKIVFHSDDFLNSQVRVYTDGGGDTLASYWTDCGTHNLTPAQLSVVARNSENDKNSSCEDIGLIKQVYETGHEKWFPVKGEAVFSLNCFVPGALLRHHLYCSVFGLCIK